MSDDAIEDAILMGADEKQVIETIITIIKESNLIFELKVMLRIIFINIMFLLFTHIAIADTKQ